MSGPLTGLKVIEIAGIGPGPFAAMLLGDMGADVIRVERPQFYAELLRATGLDGDADFAAQNAHDRWPVLKERLRSIFATRTRDEWCAVMEHTDICFAPVLAMDEAVDHPHNRERATFTDIDGVTQPAPAPRFSRTPGAVEAAVHPGEHTVEVLTDFGFDAAQIDKWRAAGVVKDRG
jgi:alpha-methylacyl-CoA racemase